ncbi:MAG: tetratricopeptide repeat protein [Candidatus Hermodarchaeota archaeon]
MNKYSKILNGIIDLRRYAESGQFAVITATMQKNPKDAKWSIAYAAFFAQHGNFDSALKHLEKALKMKGANGRAWHMTGLIRLDQDNEKKAIKAFNKGIKFEDFPEGGWVNLIEYLLMKEKSKEAVDFLNKVRKIQPDNPEVHFRLGMSYSLQMKQEAQLDAFKKAIELDATYYGRVKKELKDDPIVDKMLPEEASVIEISVDATKKSVDEAPQSHSAHAAYADALMRESRFSEAEVEVRNALDLLESTKRGPEDTQYLIFRSAYLALLGMVLLELGKYLETSEVIKEAIDIHEISGSNPELWMVYAAALQKAGRGADVPSIFRKAIHDDPENDFLWNNLKRVYEVQGRFYEADKCARVVEDELSLANRLRTLANLYVNGRELLNSLELFKELESKYPDDAEVLVDYAQLVLSMGYDAHPDTGEADFPKALELLDRAVKLNLYNYRVWYHKSRAHYIGKQFSEAEKCLEKALELKPDSEDAKRFLDIARSHSRFAKVHLFFKTRGKKEFMSENSYKVGFTVRDYILCELPFYLGMLLDKRTDTGYENEYVAPGEIVALLSLPRGASTRGNIHIDIGEIATLDSLIYPNDVLWITTAFEVMDLLQDKIIGPEMRLAGFFHFG